MADCIAIIGKSYRDLVHYIGAIAILFLFVIMMIDIEVVEKRSNNYLPLLFLLLGGFFFTLKNILYNIGIVKMKSLSINIIKKPIIRDTIFNRHADILRSELNSLNEENDNGDKISEEVMPHYWKIEKFDNLKLEKLLYRTIDNKGKEERINNIEWAIRPLKFEEDVISYIKKNWLVKLNNFPSEEDKFSSIKTNIDYDKVTRGLLDSINKGLLDLINIKKKEKLLKYELAELDKYAREAGYLEDDKLIREAGYLEDDKLITEGGYVWDLDVKFNKLLAYNYEEELQNYNYLMVVPNWDSAANRVTQISAIGDVLYTVYHSYIYIISVLLLLGMIGAIILTADSPQPVRIIKKLASVSNSQRQAQNNISLTQLNKKSGINIWYVILVLFIIIIFLFLWIRSDYNMKKSYLIVKKKDGDNYLSGLKNGFSKKNGNGHILPLRVKRDLKEITKEYWEMKEKMGEDNIMILEFKYYTWAWLNKTFPSPKVKKIIPKININNKSLTQLSKISGINIWYLISGLFIIILIIIFWFITAINNNDEYDDKVYWIVKKDRNFLLSLKNLTENYCKSIEYNTKEDRSNDLMPLKNSDDLKEITKEYWKIKRKMGKDNFEILEIQFCTTFYQDLKGEMIPSRNPKVKIVTPQENKRSKIEIIKENKENTGRKSLILPFYGVSNLNTLHTEEIIGNLFYFIVAALIIAALLLFINSYFSLSVKYLDKGGGFECGFTSFVQTRERFNVIFYRVSLLFLVFDLEIILIFPYTAIYQKYQNISKNNVLAFLYILIVGFIYELKEGALNIVKKAHTTEINNLE